MSWILFLAFARLPSMTSYGAVDEASSSAGRVGPAWLGRPLPRALLVAATVGVWVLGLGGTLPASKPAAPIALAAANPPPRTTDASLCASPTAYAARDELCNAPTAPALGGADVVAYRSLAWSADDAAREPHVQGDAAFAAAHNGFTFWFASAANRDAFRADPAAYAPKLGGFCAFGLTGADPRNLHPQLAKLYTMPVDPDVWWLDGDALYTFRGPDAMRLFLAAADDNARTAEAHWAALAVGPRAACAGADLFNTQCFRGEAA